MEFSSSSAAANPSAGILEREFRIGLEIDEGEGDIGEILLFYEFDEDTKPLEILRITFDPKLDKGADWRLYLDFKFVIDLT